MVIKELYNFITHHDTLVIILLTTWYMYTAIYFNFFFNPFICLSTRQISLLDGQLQPVSNVSGLKRIGRIPDQVLFSYTPDTAVCDCTVNCTDVQFIDC